MKTLTNSQPPAAGEAAHTFPNLYRCRDAANNEHCLCVDDSGGQRALNVTLSGHRNDEPSQRDWAAEVERRFNAHPGLVEALSGLLEQATGPAEVYGDGIGEGGTKTGLSHWEFNQLRDERIAKARAALAAAKL